MPRCSFVALSDPDSNPFASEFNSLLLATHEGFCSVDKLLPLFLGWRWWLRLVAAHHRLLFLQKVVSTATFLAFFEAFVSNAAFMLQLLLLHLEVELRCVIWK